MTDIRILEITENLGINKCPKCGASIFLVTFESTDKINVETQEIQHSSYENSETQKIVCSKCKTKVYST